MLTMSPGTKIYVYMPAADMRKGMDGLSGIVRSEFRADPTDGSMYVFINRRRDRMKILHFDGGGFWLYYRLLEAGTFEALQARDEAACLVIDSTQLAMLLSGISLVAAQRRRKRYARPYADEAA
jgi:transposase